MYHYVIRKMVQLLVITLHFVSSNSNKSDFLTKVLGATMFLRLRSVLMGRDKSHLLAPRPSSPATHAVFDSND